LKEQQFESGAANSPSHPPGADNPYHSHWLAGFQEERTIGADQRVCPIWDQGRTAELE